MRKDPGFPRARERQQFDMTAAVPASTLQPAQAQGLRTRRRHPRSDTRRAGYIFLLPWLVGFFFLTLGPTLSSLYLSFTDFNLLQPPRWVGWQNFTRMFGADPRFWGAVKVTLTYVLFSVPAKLLFALGIAL